jgi:Domain of unknown function (DUF4352)
MCHFRVPSFTAAVIAALSLYGCGDSAGPRLRTYPLGDKVTVGHIIYTGFETQWLTQIPQDPTPRIPQNRFLLVRLSAGNSGGGNLIVPNMTLEDDQGKTYEELSNGEGVAQWIGFLRQVKPADSIQGNVVFDAPPAHYKLRVTDEDAENAALIDLPLSFGVDAPTIPFPEDKKDKKQ